MRDLKRAYPDRVVGASIMGARKEHWQELAARLGPPAPTSSSAAFPVPTACPNGAWARPSGKTPS